MTKYEVMFIVKPDMEEADIKKEASNIKDVLTNKKAKFIEEKDLGQKQLAYEINKYKNGYYFLYVIEANNEAINEFNRVVSINENILRSLVVKVED